MKHRCSVIAVDVPVADLVDGSTHLLDAFAAAARTAIDTDQAEAVVLGCAGLADLVGPLTKALGVPVIDGVAAGVGIAAGLVAMGLNTSRANTFAAVPGLPDLPAGAAMTVLFRDVLVYDAASATGMTGPVDVLVDGDRIGAIGPDLPAPPDARIIEGGGRHLLVPGLINAHFHSPANHLKGSVRSLPLELFMLFESPADPALTPSPREAYLRTMLGAIEMLQRGITCVQDDAFLMPYPDPEIIDAVASAYRDSGIRAFLALDQPELTEAEKLPFVGELDDATRRVFDQPAPAAAPQLLEAYDYLIGTWHGAADDRIRAAVSISAPQRVSLDYFAALDDLAQRHGLPLYAHMLETKVQRTLMTEQSRFDGRSLVQYTAAAGLLKPHTNVIHAVWVDDADLDAIADAGSHRGAQPDQQPAPGQRRAAVAGHARSRHPGRARHRRGDLRRHHQRVDGRQGRRPDPQRLRARQRRVAHAHRDSRRPVARRRPRHGARRPGCHRARHARRPGADRPARHRVHPAQRSARAAGALRGRPGRGADDGGRRGGRRTRPCHQRRRNRVTRRSPRGVRRQAARDPRPPAAAPQTCTRPISTSCAAQRPPMSASAAG